MLPILDQPVWNALISGNSNLAQGNDKAKYFDAEVAPFADIVDQSKSFNELYEVLPESRQVAVCSLLPELILGKWSVTGRIDCLQMVYQGSIPALVDEVAVLPLSSEHIPEMIFLTGLTKPGPFVQRTIEFGQYYGIFQNNRLAAMAGERLHAGNFVEISAVCSHPDYIGRGFARRLLLQLVRRITERGEIPFLHVREDNAGAIQLYQSIGFETRTQIFFHQLKK